MFISVVKIIGFNKYLLRDRGSISFTFIQILPLFLLIFWLSIVETKISIIRIEKEFKIFLCLKKLKFKSSNIISNSLEKNETPISIMKKIDPNNLCSSYLKNNYLINR